MNYPVKVAIIVAWGEMDAFGHVNNVVFFRYFESARIAYFAELQGEGVAGEDFMPILASTECNYLKPVYFPDKLIAEASVTRVGNSSFDMAYRLNSEKYGTVVATGKATVVNVDPKSGKGVPLSAKVKDKIASIEATV